jgi:hypothetical protein
MTVQELSNDEGWCKLSRTRPLAIVVGVVKRAMRRCCVHPIAARGAHGLRSVLDLAWELLEAASVAKALSRGSLVVEACLDWEQWCGRL